MRRLYLVGTVLTLLATTVNNIRWAKERRDNEELDDESVRFAFAFFQIIFLVYSLIWFISIPAHLYILALENHRETTLRQEP